MEAHKGDHIVIESPRVAQRARKGEIVEVITGAPGQHFRVRWEDGHESTFFPSSDSRVISAGAGSLNADG